MPMLTSVVVKTFGWSVMLSSTGPVQQALNAIGLEDVRLLFTPVGVTIGLVHTYFPFMVLSLITSISAIDRRTEEAAQSLGSGPLRVFWMITLPQSLEGLLAGAALTFVTSMSALVTPQLLGGGKVTTIVTVIFQQATVAQTVAGRCARRRAPHPHSGDSLPTDNGGATCPPTLTFVGSGPSQECCSGQRLHSSASLP